MIVGALMLVEAVGILLVTKMLGGQVPATAEAAYAGEGGRGCLCPRNKTEVPG